jgi:hypothetical protein
VTADPAAPLPQSDAPGLPERRVADRSTPGLTPILRLRIVIGAVLALLSAAAAVPLFSASISTSVWGPFIAGDPAVTIRRYSSPWVVAAAGALLVAGLLMVFVVTDLVRVRRIRRSAH